MGDVTTGVDGGNNGRTGGVRGYQHEGNHQGRASEEIQFEWNLGYTSRLGVGWSRSGTIFCGDTVIQSQSFQGAVR